MSFLSGPGDPLRGPVPDPNANEIEPKPKTIAAVVKMTDAVRVMGLGEHTGVENVIEGGWVQVGESLISPHGIVIAFMPDTPENQAMLKEWAR